MQSKSIGMGMILLGFLLIATVCIGKAEEKQEDPRIETIQVVSIIGNELTYFSSSVSENGIRDQRTEDKPENKPENKPERTAENPDRGEKTENTRNTDSNNSSEKRSGKGKGGSRTSKTVYLPVAVPVHTGEERVRTFTILQANDVLEVKIMKNAAGEECIVEIWMEGTRMEDE